MSTTTTVKILNNLRIQAPGAVDAAIQLEMFNVVEELCARYLQITPPTDPTTDPSTWLSDANYQLYSRLIIDGTLARILAQVAKPWTNTKLAEIHQQLYTEGLYVIQGNAGMTTVTTSPAATLTQRLMDNLRMNLPGAQDAWSTLELFNTVDEFCRTTNGWQDVEPITLVVGQTTYTITPAQTEILEIVQIAHPTLNLVSAAYSFGKLALLTPPTAVDVAAGQLLVTLNLTPDIDPGTDPEHWIPADMWRTHYQVWLHGVLGRMMSQLSKPYSNPQMGVYHLKKFRSLMFEAKHAIDAGPVPDGQTWKFPYFGSTHKNSLGGWGGVL